MVKQQREKELLIEIMLCIAKIINHFCVNFFKAPGYHMDVYSHNDNCKTYDLSGSLSNINTQIGS